MKAKEKQKLRSEDGETACHVSVVKITLDLHEVDQVLAEIRLAVSDQPHVLYPFLRALHNKLGKLPS